MNMNKKIIITDTNIITDLNTCKLLDKFAQLDNVYINDICKREKIKEKTGGIDVINKIKEIKVTSEELLEATKLFRNIGKLSIFDVLNYVVAKYHNAILATGDNRLKKFAESNDVEVVRTLKIIRWMREKNIIKNNEVIDACILLKNDSKTFIPIELIDELINEYNQDLVGIN